MEIDVKIERYADWPARGTEHEDAESEKLVLAMLSSGSSPASRKNRAACLRMQERSNRLAIPSATNIRPDLIRLNST